MSLSTAVCFQRQQDQQKRFEWHPRKRSKKTAEIIIPIEGKTNQHPILQEDFEHPQPVSKHISFGLPISNPYLKLKQKQALSLSKKNHPKNPPPSSNIPVPQGRNNCETPAIPMTQSFLQFSIDCSSPSGSESTSFEIGRAHV